MKNWTKEQKAAIDARKSNLLVSAAAGSGKTAVLVERIIQMILQDKMDIDKLLIVTFTNAAAGEMRERIADAIVKELEKQDENEEHLRRQMALLNKASITTLHAFCIEVVKKHFHFIDIDPTFRIGDVTETSILQLEALEELLENEYEKSNSSFIELVERFGGTREDTPLQDLILKIYRFIQSQPKPYQWLRDRVEDFNLDLENFEKSLWMHTIKEGIEINLKGAIDLLKEAKEICNRPDGPFKYTEAIEDDIKQIEDLQQTLEAGMVPFYKKIGGFKHKTLGRGKQEVSEALKEEVKSLREKGKDILKAIKKDIFALSPQEYIEDLKTLYPLMLYLWQMVESFGKLYSHKKNERGIVDFNDLEHYALAILENDKAAKEYQDRFQYIFIDEYQDSNIVQETLIHSIKRNDNLFMVGDVKQSIYRFRLADPTLFIEKYESFQLESGALNRRIDLSKNFRSRKEVLGGVNYLFKHIMSKALGEINYNEEAYLYEGRSFEAIKDPSIEVKIIEKDFEIEEEIEAEIEELEDIEVEARIVASRIKELLKEEIYDPEKKEYRSIQYKDIVVLMRTTQNWAEAFLETFIRENIPAYADASTGYFEAIEINMFMNLLKIIDNKRQDLPLLSVMRSPIGKFSVDQLMEIRICHKEGSFYEAIEAYIDIQDNDLTEKLKTLIIQLSHWADEARFMKIDEFIWKLFIDTGYFYYVGAMPGGQQKQANLRILLDRASQFEKTSIKGLFNFIKFIEKLERSKGDMGAAKILGENDNVVRIMSIHKSKGLEFPVVITAGLGKNFNLRDTNADVLMHKDLGLGPKFVDLELRTYRDTIAKLAMRDKIKMESLSEEMRILYVAMTRPMDKLILVGSIKNLPKQVEKWNKGMNPYMLSSAKNYLDWIGMVLTKHRDGEPLRQAAEIELQQDKIVEDSSHWAVSILNRQHIILEEQEKTDHKKEIREKLEKFQREEFTPFKEKIDAILNWRYPYERATIIPSKLSVSQIKRSTAVNMDSISYSIPNLVKRPKFMEGTKAFTAAERGTILHFVLQHLDFKMAEGHNNIEEQIQMMVIKELLTEEEAKTVDICKIEGLLKSELGRRMLMANKIFREIAFNIKKKAVDVIIDLEDCDESLLVQGIIDCYFEEKEKLILIDYKSDYVPNGNTSIIIQKYEVQLQLYKEALEKITGKNVKESYIYLLDIDTAVRLEQTYKGKDEYFFK
ncbi:DNA helicase/exodeoxyribonuclease V, subunit A [Anaerovirgula multivorans]|uniref:ATP-dependent helicase/nuclease subunit A n=1 Tax=Anaerovirgula multivorans TaxID=312168 RepID=A0A239BPN7_9FIRM|nr:helicase-exonuclease AddAB subunit AddA [Anaerovirgula multivorans]SNS10057.1 DNA helicase/exodeoxyribonuclease V, subunit A [Anaerovirgula multivorans]